MDSPVKEKTKKKLLSVSESVSNFSEEALLSSIEYRRKLKYNGVEFDEDILNILEFILLLNFEINCLLTDMVNSTSKLGPNLYGRHILLIIHESTLTLRSILAKQFKEDSEYVFKSIKIDELKNIHSRICKLHDKAVKKFGDVRNGITAHKDKDPDIRIKLIEDSDVREVTDLVLEFFPITIALQKPLYQYLQSLKK